MHLMKSMLYIVLIVGCLANAQRDRIQIQGTIMTQNVESLGGITVFNNSSLEGTVTNDNGTFLIDVKEGDKLEFRSLQFTNFKVTIGTETLAAKSIKITLNESINELDEVRVTNSSFMVPVKRLVEFKDGLSDVSARNVRIAANDRMENTFSDRVRQPEEYALRHEAFMQSQPRFNMINLVGMLSALVIGTTLNAINVDGGAGPRPNAEEFDVVVLKNKFSTQYLVEFLEIKEENLYEFMYFTKDRGLDNTYFTPDRELDLLQFLSESAVLFKERKRR